ncbi:MAG: hypothetical protein E7380_00390 [Clostridiales bacterium]|nr:hypothetical protein [Clostridiales bacterium]
MKKFQKVIAVAASMMLLCGAFAGCNVADDGKDDSKNVEEVQKYDWAGKGYTKLTIDAGGQNASYNSTKNLIYDKYSNPYPYNELERLVEEWNKANADSYAYYFEVADSSINNDRETMLPMLQNKNAPEIIYYLPTTIAEDMDKGFFYDLSSVMETPNKYSKEGEAGSVAWKDLYSAEDYAGFFAPNGHMYTVTMEKNPIGLLYNKTLFNAAGITETPDTYKEFMEAQDKLNAYAVSVGRGDPNQDDTYITPYFMMYPWYDSFLESTLLSSSMTKLDVIKKDGMVDAEEFVRGYMLKDANDNRLYNPNSDVYVELYRLIKQMCKYYPTKWSSYYNSQQFVAGNVGMLEVTGGDIRELIDQVDGDFEVGVMPYPVLETQPAGEAASPYYTTYEIAGNVRRGLSGYCTGWAISNSAMAKDDKNNNDKCVNACIDVLMYLSCYENNDMMVNKRGFAIPLSGNTSYEHFRTLAEVYATDCANETTVAWGAATAGSSMNKDYYDAVYLFRTKALNGADVASELRNLESSFTSAANNLYTQNKWDKPSWPVA